MNILEQTDPEINPNADPAPRGTLQNRRGILLSAAVFVTQIGHAAVASEGDSDSESQIAPPPSGVYFCAISDAIEGIDGRSTFDAMKDYQSPPVRTEFPLKDRDHVTDDGYSHKNRYYWYIKTRPIEFGTYTVHGVFDFETLTLSTSRSAVMPLEGGGIGSVATSFGFLCTTAE